MPNTSTNKKPVIFLAFANDRVDEAAYLRNLPKEMSGIRTALDKAVKAGLCELVERANATIEDILNVFQDNYFKDRIAIFHYGGHANGYQLLLETMEGEHAAAHSEGLVSFLAKQQGLKMVFLNGCSSQQQALDLVTAGVSSVVGTSQSINDDVATSLSVRFYSALGNGANLSRAWAEAVDQVKIQKGTANMRDFFWDGMEDGSNIESENEGLTSTSEKQVQATVIDRFPWDIYFKEGAELVKHWNLPEAVENPLFGLPEPERRNLPDAPFRFLERYKREHAEIFFGRSYYIRDLFNTAMDSMAAPVILFYGQSGVGKSSMLDAGLFPRLEQVAKVVYIRRKQRLGLLGTLKRALGMSKHQSENAEQYEGKAKLKEQIDQIQGLIDKSEGIAKERLEEAMIAYKNQLAEQKSLLEKKESKAVLAELSDLLDVWHFTEKQYGKPLIVLLDQVEEFYTRPNKKMANELESFLQEVQTIFSSPKMRPKGKIILSYRKEYHPEINEACKSFTIPREEIFLKALGRKDIAEVITGLTKTQRLQKKYRLEVEENLPIIIADDLLEDKDSSIAPVLQILLTKMWKLSEEENNDHRFTVQTYQTLRAQGILMDDFFKEQMEVLELRYPDMVKSGLALDVLDNHTTKLGTADTRHLDELRERYSDRQEKIEGLLKEFKRLYLLTDTGAASTGLAHDTLAPLVQDEFRHSDKLGQRAALILENKVIAFDQDPETVIDIDDLKIVEAGAGGMRLWTQKEQELIDKSRAKREKTLFEKKRNKRVLYVLLGVIFLGIVATLILSKINETKLADKTEQIEIEKDAALKAQKEAIKAREDAENKRKEAEIAKEEAEVRRKEAEEAKEEAAREANRAKSNADKARKAQTTALINAKRAEDALSAADSARIVAEKKEEEAKKAGDEARKKGKQANMQLYFAQAREIAIKSSLMQESDTLKALLAIKAFELEKEAMERFSIGNEKVNDSHEIFEAMEAAVKAFNNDSLYAGESWDVEVDERKVVLSDKRGHMIYGEIIPQDGGSLPKFGIYREVQAPNPKARVYAIAHLPEAKYAYGMSDGSVVLNSGSQNQIVYTHGDVNVLSMVYATEKKWLISSSDDNQLIAWDLPNDTEIARYQHDVPINQLHVYKDYLFGIDRDGRVLFWELGRTGQKPIVLWEHPEVPLVSLAYSPKNHWLAFGASNGEVFILSVDDPSTIREFNKHHKGKVSALVFSPDERFLASASFDGTLMSWKLNAAENNLQKLTNQVPAVIQGDGKIFSLEFDQKSEYLIFSDKDALKARVINADILYDKLKTLTNGKQLNQEEKEIYLGGIEDEN